jgi:hypothetical protein
LRPGEDRIAKALRERVRTYHALVPPWRSVVTSVLLAFAAVLPAAALLPAAVTLPARLGRVPLTGLPLLAALTAAALTAGGAAHVVLRLARRRRAGQAESDLLRFLCLCYAHRCERWEDRQRVTSLGRLRWWVQRTLRDLEEVDAFFSSVRSSLREGQEEVERSLLDTPSGALDVLVAEGRRLVRADGDDPGGSDQVTLAAVLAEARHRLRPGAEPASLSNAFLNELEDVTHLLEMDEAELQDQVIAFVQERMQETVLGDAATGVYQALRTPGVQRRAAYHLGSSLFPQLGTMQPRERYLCGRPLTQEPTGLPERHHLVLGEQTEWWLLAAAYADGSGAATLGPGLIDSLFPALRDDVRGVA